MSKRTQANRIWLISAAFLSVLTPSIGKAGAVSDAQDQLNNAYDDYYEALSAGGKKTPEEQKALKQKIVDPAMKSLNQAMKQEADQVIRDHAKNPSQVGQSSDGGASLTTSEPVNKERAPDVTLDGTDIPRELEFPGKPLQPVQTAPKPTSSYTGPYAPKAQ